MSEPALEDALLGCLLGGALGDALGSLVEGRASGVAVDLDAPELGVITDDTQLTLSTCEAIIAASGRIEPARIAASFLEVHRTSGITQAGASTMEAVRGLEAGGHWALVGRRGERAAGNGAAMRIAPLAFLVDPEDFFERQVIRDVCRITHHSEEAYVAALAVVMGVRWSIEQSWPAEAPLWHLADALPDSRTTDVLRQVHLAGASDVSSISAITGASGYAPESVPLALGAAVRAMDVGLAQVFADICALGRGADADTIASIAGQVVGAIGVDVLPAGWLERLSVRGSIEQAAHRMAAHLGSSPPIC